MECSSVVVLTTREPASKKDKKEMKMWVEGGDKCGYRNKEKALSYSRQRFVMIRQIEEGDTSGGIIIPKDKFVEFEEFQRRWVEGKSLSSSLRMKAPRRGASAASSAVVLCRHALSASPSSQARPVQYSKASNARRTAASATRIGAPKRKPPFRSLNAAKYSFMPGWL
jgi:hypothetical protein